MVMSGGWQIWVVVLSLSALLVLVLATAIRRSH
jgi:hypothetical protein